MHSINPIVETLEYWPLAGSFRMRWGQDASGEMWVAVENARGDCQFLLPYQDYLDMESSPHVTARELPRQQ